MSMPTLLDCQLIASALCIYLTVSIMMAEVTNKRQASQMWMTVQILGHLASG